MTETLTDLTRVADAIVKTGLMPLAIDLVEERRMTLPDAFTYVFGLAAELLGKEPS